MKAFDSNPNLLFAMLLATIFCLPHASAADIKPISIPRHFLGGFEAKMPAIIGDAIPNTTMSVLCEEKSGCFLVSGEHGQRFPLVRTFSRKDVANDALTYAKAHKNVVAQSPMAWYAKNLMPLLSSSAIIESCVDLAEKSTYNDPPSGQILICKLNKSPWPKPVVLLMGVRMGQTSGCGELYCDYEIHPLFQTNLDQLHGMDLSRLKIKLGDTLKNVKNAYPNVGEPKMTLGINNPDYNELRINEDITLNFESKGKIDRIVLGRGFIGNILGISIGDTLEMVSKTLGDPIDKGNTHNGAYGIYGPFDNFHLHVSFDRYGQVGFIIIEK